MTRVFDFSTYDIRDHKYAFSEMTDAEILEKKAALEEFQKAKATQASPKAADDTKPAAPPSSRPVFKPRMKPPGKPS